MQPITDTEKYNSYLEVLAGVNSILVNNGFRQVENITPDQFERAYAEYEKSERRFRIAFDGRDGGISIEGSDESGSYQDIVDPIYDSALKPDFMFQVLSAVTEYTQG